MTEPQQTTPQSKPRPKIKSSFGAVLKTQQEAEQVQDTSSLIPQSPSISVKQDTDILEAPQKATKVKRTKKGVYLKPATAKWLDIQAATEGKEISEITEEALTLLRKVRAGQAEIKES